MTLPALQTKNNMFCLAQLDHALAVEELLGQDLSMESNFRAVSNIITWQAQAYSQVASGLIFDPIYSFESTKSATDAGTILRLEQFGQEINPTALPKLINNWGVEDVRQNYGVAKLEIFFHPQEENAVAKKQLVAEIYDHCKHLGISFILKLSVYTPSGQDFNLVQFQEDQLTSVHEFNANCDLLCLQYPQEALATATITAQIDQPWIVCADGVDYQSYKEIVRTSLENGAKGFMVDQVLFREIEKMRLSDKSPDLEKIRKFIETESKDRLIELVRIANEVGQDGT